jgi:hypothetical protein
MDVGATGPSSRRAKRSGVSSSHGASVNQPSPECRSTTEWNPSAPGEWHECAEQRHLKAIPRRLSAT